VPARLRIRPARRADRVAVVGLLVAQFREHRIRLAPRALDRAVAGILAHPARGRLILALVDRRTVGVAALGFTWPLEHGGRSAWLEELYVVPAARGRGIGTALLRVACRLAARCGAAAIDLEVDVRHRRAGRLYARAGFHRLPRTRWVRRLPRPRRGVGG